MRRWRRLNPTRITSYNVCYTKLLRIAKVAEGGSLRVVSENVDAQKILEEPVAQETQGSEYVSSNDADEILSPAPMAKVSNGNASPGKGPGLGASSPTDHPVDIEDPVAPAITPRPRNNFV